MMSLHLWRVIHYNMIVVFFSPASIDSSLVSTDSSPVSTDSSLLAFLLLEPSPLQSKCTLVNKICIVLYFDNILFYLIWKKYFFNQKKKNINSQIKYFPEKYSWHQSMATPSHFNATGCRIWSTGSDMSQSSVVNSMQMGPSEIAVVQFSRTKYTMKCYHDMVDQIPPKRILWPWNQWESHCLHRRPHIWNSRTSGASRHQNTRELPLEQKVNLHQVGDPIKRHTDLFKYGYILYV